MKKHYSFRKIVCALLIGVVLCTVLTGALLVSCMIPTNYLEPDVPKSKEDFAPPLPSPGNTIKVVTFNIAYAKNIERAIYELNAWPELQDADILLLQEMDYDGPQRIAHALHYNYVYYPASIHPLNGKHFGNAILSKWPISEEAKILLPHKNPVSKQVRIAVSATITIANDHITVYNIHAETIVLRRSKRLDQVKALIDHISGQQALEYIIVGGDFNTVRKKNIATITQLFNDVGLERATEQVGATSKIFLPLDHIYTKGLHVIDAGKVKNTGASDHFPVWVILEKMSVTSWHGR
jgi:endonuclease/exonuclease/phosphatase family metal-dependent hydrolase